MNKAIVLSVIVVLTHGKAIAQDTFGRFTSSAKVEFVTSGPGAGQDVTLLEDFSYVDPDGTTWTAHKGFESDGASIPQIFWSLVGGPLEGPYRDAAIIHDWYCDKKDHPYQDVHRIFYYASRAAGVGETKAKILYLAVRYGGPRWGKGPSGCYAGCHTSVSAEGLFVGSPTVSADQAERWAKWVQDTNPTLEEIDKNAPNVHGIN